MKDKKIYTVNNIVVCANPRIKKLVVNYAKLNKVTTSRAASIILTSFFDDMETADYESILNILTY